ncbi:MAG: hypothetical protein HY869_02015 [Chloroflexi bacterium]|nr:hypothetical protein [Chloroflexota bacterium]
MKFLKGILQDIRQKQNLDIYLAIIIAIVVSILGAAQIADQTVVSSTVLATLALVSLSLLANRRENDEIQNNLSKLTGTGQLADKFFRKEHDTSKVLQLIRNSRKVYFLGSSFTALIPLIREELSNNPPNELELKFLLMKPSGHAASIAAFRGDRSIDEVNSSIVKSLSDIEQLAKKMINGKVECRVIDYLTPYNIEAFDPQLPSGRMFVRLAAFRTSTFIRPLFDLTSKNDSAWFKFFLEQFETLWEESDARVLNN